jgi:hypothetical protein
MLSLSSINGWHLLVASGSLLLLFCILLYSKPPSSAKGRWIAEVWTVSPFNHGTQVRWRRRYKYRWQAVWAAKAEARLMDHIGAVHWEFGIDWGVRGL